MRAWLTVAFMLAACEPFGAAPPPDTQDGGTSDAALEGGRSDGSETPSDPAGRPCEGSCQKGETCCLATGGLQCSTSCNGWRVECMSSSECPRDSVCCMETNGVAACKEDCPSERGRVLCSTSSECGTQQDCKLVPCSAAGGSSMSVFQHCYVGGFSATGGAVSCSIE